MKPNTNIQKKKIHGPAPSARKPGPGRPATPKRSPGFLLICFLCLVFVGTGTWALFEFVIWNVTPPELVGKWVVVEGPQEGATFDFYRNGTLLGRLNVRGKEHIVDARIRVEDRKIYSTTRNPNTGQDDTRIQIIRTLTATDLVTEDEQGGVLKMERTR
jgi:hypothetical protein